MEAVKETPDQIAIRMKQMEVIIEEQQNQIATRDWQIKQYEAQTKKFGSLGPLKAHVESLEEQIIS